MFGGNGSKRKRIGAGGVKKKRERRGGPPCFLCRAASARASLSIVLFASLSRGRVAKYVPPPGIWRIAPGGALPSRGLPRGEGDDLRRTVGGESKKEKSERGRAGRRQGGLVRRRRDGWLLMCWVCRVKVGGPGSNTVAKEGGRGGGRRYRRLGWVVGERTERESARARRARASGARRKRKGGRGTVRALSFVFLARSLHSLARSLAQRLSLNSRHPRCSGAARARARARGVQKGLVSGRERGGAGAQLGRFPPPRGRRRRRGRQGRARRGGGEEQEQGSSRWVYVLYVMWNAVGGRGDKRRRIGARPGRGGRKRKRKKHEGPGRQTSVAWPRPEQWAGFVGRGERGFSAPPHVVVVGGCGRARKRGDGKEDEDEKGAGGPAGGRARARALFRSLFFASFLILARGAPVEGGCLWINLSLSRISLSNLGEFSLLLSRIKRARTPLVRGTRGLCARGRQEGPTNDDDEEWGVWVCGRRGAAAAAEPPSPRPSRSLAALPLSLAGPRENKRPRRSVFFRVPRDSPIRRSMRASEKERGGGGRGRGGRKGGRVFFPPAMGGKKRGRRPRFPPRFSVSPDLFSSFIRSWS